MTYLVKKIAISEDKLTIVGIVGWWAKTAAHTYVILSLAIRLMIYVIGLCLALL